MKPSLVIDVVDLQRKISRAADKKRQIAKDRVYAAGDVFENGAVQMAPEDTGELKDKISAEKKVGRKGPEVHVGTEAEHGAFQEFGTSEHGAQPFIRPALQQAVSHLRARVR